MKIYFKVKLKDKTQVVVNGRDEEDAIRNAKCSYGSNSVDKILYKCDYWGKKII